MQLIIRVSAGKTMSECLSFRSKTLQDNSKKQEHSEKEVFLQTLL